VWSRRIIWGSHRLSHGIIKPSANAWKNGVLWGGAKPLASDGDNIVWGTMSDGDNIVWGTADGDNIVWGTASDGDNIVWGTADGDNIVWGTDCDGDDCDGVIWGSSDGDNIVWGTASDGDNIVWGTSADGDLVWGSDAGDDTVTFPDDASDPLPSLDLEFGDVVPLPAVTSGLSSLLPVSIGG
jgi:hypothetical protein